MTAKHTDRLEEMFKLRREFMRALSQLRPEASFSGDAPLDLSKKDNQRHIRDISLRGVEEVFESCGLLKNWKPHRATEIEDFDREAFLEEWIDAFNYFLSVLILSGFDAEDVFRMYVQKDRIIHERLKTGY